LIGDLKGVVDMVRFAIAPKRLGAAVELAEACDALGFQVGLNVMYLNTYVDSAKVLEPLVSAKAAVVALVDSYGGCTPSEVGRAVAAARDLLPQPIGFHGHDNISLAFANSVAALEAGASVVDATVQGMGRGAGNTKTELMAAFFSAKRKQPVDFSTLSATVEQFGALQKQYGWGTNLAYMVSGLEGLPQADVMDWLGTRRYSMASIVAALRQQGSGQTDDRVFPTLAGSDLYRTVAGRPVLIVGGGESVALHIDALRQFVISQNAVVIHSTTRRAELFDTLPGVQIYCLAGQEIVRLSGERAKILSREDRYIVTQEAPRLPGAVPPGGNVFQVANWAPVDARNKLGPIADEPPLDLAFSAAEGMVASTVYLAGFDGYQDASLADQHNARDVQTALDQARLRWAGRVSAVTPTLYAVETTSVYGLLQTADQ
jgi:4-hydroxy 2-oxovalerate aldolase